MISRYVNLCLRKSHKISREDAVAWLKSLPQNSVDLFVTDPAYESLEKHRKGDAARLKNWFEIFPDTRYPELFAEMFRVLKNNRHAYVFCDPSTAFVIKPIAEAAGFKFWKPLVWDKIHIGMGYHYRSRYEFVMFFEKGKRSLSDLSIADVIDCKRIRGGYPTEKPPEVSQLLIEQSTFTGEIVADPFMGSGSVALAARECQRIFWGTDISEIARKMTARRLIE